MVDGGRNISVDNESYIEKCVLQVVLKLMRMVKKTLVEKTEKK